MTETVIWQSPVGALRLESNGGALTGLWFVDVAEGPRWRDPVGREAASGDRRAQPPWNRNSPPRTRDSVLRAALTQLVEYFAGARQRFDLKLAPAGTEFQRRVWRALTEIPWGTTWSYGELARHLGKQGASRAVGAANGKNPISIIVPCHRVIAASGGLGGYSGGLGVKEALLRHEGVRWRA
jgi:methylated-DNA-[protein]-cysteine S-methyltransferase